MLRLEPRTGPVSEEMIARISEQTGVSSLLARLLAARGLTEPDTINAFLDPDIKRLYDPMLLPDMPAAADRLKEAIEKKEPVCVYGDYDADGILATAMLTKFLRSIAANVSYHIPSRHLEGYGMNLKTVKELKDKGISLIVTVDNGVGAVDEIAECTKLGMDVIVTDHHQCKYELPKCTAVIDHNRPDSLYPERFLCGAGIALKLIRAIGGDKASEPYIPLAGIATIADVVPLLGENRVLAACALLALNSGACPPGLLALGESCKQQKREYTVRDVSFGIAPRLNASGRMEDASVAVELMLTEDHGKIREIVEKLNCLNSQRQNEETEILEQAKEMISEDRISSRRCIVLSSAGWNPGIIGIAASRLAESYNRPVILFSENDGILTGSGRTAAGLDLCELLTRFKDSFIRFGGHAGAAGVTMRKTELEPFMESLNEYLIGMYPAARFIPMQKYELRLKLSEITESLIHDIDSLAPFGEGNPVPLICSEPVELESIRVIGEKGDHLKVTLKQDKRAFDAVAFGKGDRFADYSAINKAKVAFSPIINEWKNMKQIQLQIKAFERLPIADPAEYIKKQEQKFYDAISRNILYNDMREIGRAKAVDSDEAFRNFSDSDIAGTLVLCFTPSGAERFLKKSGSGWADIRFFTHDDDPCAYNTVVFAPVIEKLKLSRYDRILVYDCCFSTGMIAELARHAEVFVSDKVSEGLSVIEKFSVNRDELKIHYGALNSLARSGIPVKEEVLAQLEQSTGSPPHIARLALAIFEELGFVKNDIEAGWSVVDMSRRRSLDESRCFSNANSMASMLQEYSLRIKTIQENQYGS